MGNNRYVVEIVPSETVPYKAREEREEDIVGEVVEQGEVKEKIVQKEKEAIVEKKLSPMYRARPVFVPLETKRAKFSFSKKFRPVFKNIIVRGFVFALSLYLGVLAFALTISYLSLRNNLATISRGELPYPNALSSASLVFLEANWITLTSLPVLSSNQSVKDVTLLLDAYNQSLSILSMSRQLSDSFAKLSEYIFGKGGGDPVTLISTSRLVAEELSDRLSLLLGVLPSSPPSIITEDKVNKYQEARSNLDKLKHSLDVSRGLLSVAPEMIGIGGRRKYAVLFQNNMELRATGGFIGSFAVLSFENGKLYDMPIYDVYDADGQLKGHVEPPAPIKTILGEANWYLRDSNYDPDFPTSARRAEWFLKKTLNLDLDGTIAINVDTLRSILNSLGEIQLPDYNETITAANLYERAQYHAEVNFFAGSTQKKEFLSSVASVIFARLPSLAEGEGLKLVKALTDSIDEKNTLLSFVSNPIDRVFKLLGWNGEVADPPCPINTACHKDYAMVVSSNFGVNKANYFIKRNIEEVITMDKDLVVNHVLRISYHNSSTSSAWPAGAYKNYERTYLPLGASLSGIKIGDKTLSSSEYALSQEHDKLIVGYLVNVPINSDATVELTYSTPQLPGENSLIYTWYWQKQPGTSKEDNLTIYLNYPMYLKPSMISPVATLSSQQLNFSFKNDTDHRITVKLTK